MCWKNNLKVAAVLAAFNLGRHASCNSSVPGSGRGKSKKVYSKKLSCQDVESKKNNQVVGAPTYELNSNSYCPEGKEFMNGYLFLI